jgi:hypothetical protein
LTRSPSQINVIKWINHPSCSKIKEVVTANEEDFERFEEIEAVNPLR